MTELRTGRRAEQKRRWDREHVTKTCPSCGGPMYRSSERCRLCHEAIQETRRIFIERLWAQGHSTKEIRKITGTPAFQAGAYRAIGWNLPPRHRTGWGRWG